MGFRLFGVNVEIQLGFWIGSVLIYLGSGVLGVELLVWVAVVLVSVLVHEYGHALAIMRHGIEPEIALHWMGGTTSWRQALPLRRLDHVIISLAGPFAGFAFAAPLYALSHFGDHFVARMPHLAQVALSDLLWVNIGWGLVNLIPVLPWDGGHVLEHALGPKRVRLTAWISLIIGTGIALFALLVLKSIWIAFIFGIGVLNSFQRLRTAVQPVMPARPVRSEAEGPPLAPEVAQIVRRAQLALAEDDPERARALAEEILASQPDPRAAHAAFEIIAWSYLASKETERAAEALSLARKIAEPDRALSGAVFLAKRDLKEARRVLEEARAARDDRKEVVGPLIQILLEQGETARAAAIAYDIVESLSEDDVRKMAKIAFDGGAVDWAGRLFETAFERQGSADDAYDAARAHAAEGDRDRALELLRRAVDAGFSDRARAWSDVAFEPLRSGGELETVVPRP